MSPPEPSPGRNTTRPSSGCVLCPKGFELSTSSRRIGKKCKLVEEKRQVGENMERDKLLWEWGPWTPGDTLTLKAARERQRACDDTRTERSALEKLLNCSGYVLMMSTKAYPEVAGKGFQYPWWPGGKGGNIVREKNASRSTSRERAGGVH